MNWFKFVGNWSQVRRNNSMLSLKKAKENLKLNNGEHTIIWLPKIKEVV